MIARSFLLLGAFKNYVYKRRGVGGQKKPNLVNIVCERPRRVKLRVVLRAGSSWSGKIITSGQSLFFGSQGVPKCSQLTHCTVPLSIPVGKGLMLPFPVTRCHISHFSREMARRQFNPLV